MRSLLPDLASEPDVHAHYADGWLDAGGIRANFIASVDGAISANGLSRGLQTPGDNRVFGALRDLADVVLVGSGTAQAEGYEPIQLSAARQRRRLDLGLSAQPVTAVVSGSLHVDASAKLYSDPATVVFTSARADHREMAAEVRVTGESHVELRSVVATLKDRGLTRVLCEGGPTLLASVGGAGLLDELCLTLSPLLVGPGPGRLSAGAPWEQPRSMTLVGLLEEDGALFCRYRSAPQSGDDVV